MMVATARNQRRGVALIWVLVILVLLSALISATTIRTLAGRRLLEQRHAQLQADWLARSGLEIAVAHLLDKPEHYEGETVEPIPSSRVKIEVKQDDGKPNIYLVSCEATYPTKGRVPVTRRLSRSFERKTEKEQAWIVVVKGTVDGQ
jgi:Tfp pilus assembly protein PilX